MACRVVTIASGKGGVGKSTIAANLTVALAKMGQRVTAIDGDIGLRNLDVILGVENRIIYDLVDVAEGRCHLMQALIHDQRLPELQLLPASQTQDKSALAPESLLAICHQLRPSNDFVLIDSPAGIDRGFHNAIAPADEVIIVTTPEVSAVRDADRVLGILENLGNGVPRLIINRIRPTLVRRGDMLDTFDVIEFLAVDLLGVIPEDDATIVATNRGTPLACEPVTPAGVAYHNIARRILGQQVPYMDILDESSGWVDRLRRLVSRR